MPADSMPGVPRAVAALAVTAALAGCAGPPPRPVAPLRPATVERYGAPTIDRPRDLRSRALDPCGTLLSPAQLSTLGYRVRKSRDVVGLATACDWDGTAPGRATEAAVSVDHDLFVSTYRVKLLPIFRPVTIAGLPAVEEQSPSAPSSCTTTVGVAERQALEVTVYVTDIRRDGSTPIEPCAEGRRVVEAIVSTLPPS